MVLPGLYDILCQATLGQNRSHHPTQLQPREVAPPHAIRCVSPLTETSLSSDGTTSFPGSHADALSNRYAYSVGPFAHAKSEGLRTLVKSLSKSRCWILKDFTAAPKPWLGSGKFGSVRLYRTGSHRTMPVALKKLDKSTSHDPTMWKREVEIHTGLAHSSIVPCLGYFQTHSSLYIVLDYCSGGDLAKFMTNYELSTRDCKNVVTQIASALVHLQQHNIAHRDVKTENILVGSNKQLQVKLGDFGYAIHCPNSDLRGTLCGTLACLPPEMLALNGKQYRAMHVDAWSLGILTYELVLQEPLFAWPGNTKDMKEQIRRFRDTSLHVPGSRTFSNFVSSLLRHKPSSRITPSQAMQHSWLIHGQLPVEVEGKGAKRCRLV